MDMRAALTVTLVIDERELIKQGGGSCPPERPSSGGSCRDGGDLLVIGYSVQVLRDDCGLFDELLNPGGDRLTDMDGLSNHNTNKGERGRSTRQMMMSMVTREATVSLPLKMERSLR